MSNTSGTITDGTVTGLPYRLWEAAGHHDLLCLMDIHGNIDIPTTTIQAAEKKFLDLRKECNEHWPSIGEGLFGLRLVQPVWMRKHT